MYKLDHLKRKTEVIIFPQAQGKARVSETDSDYVIWSAELSYSNLINY